MLQIRYDSARQKSVEYVKTSEPSVHPKNRRQNYESPEFFLTTAIVLSVLVASGTAAFAQRPSTDRHVAELGRYFNGVKIAAPIVEQTPGDLSGTRG